MIDDRNAHYIGLRAVAQAYSQGNIGIDEFREYQIDEVCSSRTNDNSHPLARLANFIEAKLAEWQDLDGTEAFFRDEIRNYLGSDQTTGTANIIATNLALASPAQPGDAPQKENGQK